MRPGRGVTVNTGVTSDLGDEYRESGEVSEKSESSADIVAAADATGARCVLVESAEHDGLGRASQTLSPNGSALCIPRPHRSPH
jgi:hypothetical protein